MTRSAPSLRALAATLAHTSAAALVVLGVSALLAAGATFAIGGARDARDDTLRAAVAATAPSQRDLSDGMRGSISPRPGSVTHGLDPETASAWGATFDRLTAIGETMPPEVAAITGDPRAVVRLDRAKAVPVDGARAPDTELILSFDPALAGLVTVVEGTLPGPIAPGEPIPIALTETVAEQFGWPLGQVRNVQYSAGARELVLVGLLEARDPDAGEWDHAAVALQASEVDNFERPPTFIGVGYADAASVGSVAELAAASRVEFWFPVHPERLQADAAERTAEGLHRFSSTVNELPVLMNVGSVFPVTVTPAGTTAGVISQTLPLLGTLTALLGVAASGVALAGAAVLVLAVRAIVTRRRPLLALVAARGASDGARAGFLAVDAALPAVLGSVLGVGAGSVVLGEAPAPGAVFAGIAVVVIAAVAAALTGALLVRTRMRVDDRARTRSRLRTALEGGAVLVAGGLVAILLTTPASARSGTSPLAIVVPAALVALGCLLALRLTPLALRGAEALGRRRRGLVPLLGPARAGRDPSAGAVPVLALIAGIAVAVLGAGLHATVTDGIRDAARSQVGADVRVDARYLGAELALAAAQTEGIAASALVSDDDDVELEFPDGDGRITVYAVDPEAFRAAAADGVPVPPDGTDPIRALVSRTVADRLDGAGIELAGTAIETAQVVPDDSPFGRANSWIAIPLDAAEQLRLKVTPSAFVARVEPDADAAEVRGRLAALFDGIGTARTPQDVVADRVDAPAVRSLVAALTVAVVAAGVLTVLGALLALSLAAPARGRLFALLRALGSPARREYALVVWELAPALLLAVPIGAVVGVALVPLVTAGVELTTFTGGSAAPAVSLGLAASGLVVAALVAVVAVAVLAAAAIARIPGATRAVRTVDEEG
ncbi:FtsX-like permease family protein [Protaetiibacter intestinalis]|uniref:FtsX-like permease family protein n=1 Tax=Protaetiibacter intestinalis TaxID=2419774 RepID=A0A387B7J4_9MICO|nr:FtsX-like permease family protein [Protaetiibacter intestinalis]AYF97056.1 FtsX-like permease family protein [Protaetiibacter intestinalis]